jgi:hypothetical protein
VTPFAAVAPTAAEIAAPRAGDELLPDADVVMDRAFTVAAPPAEVRPWDAQLGKGRAGWYLPARIEQVLPRRYRCGSASAARDPAVRRCRRR